MNADWRSLAVNPQTKPTNMGCESANNNWQLPSICPQILLVS